MTLECHHNFRLDQMVWANFSDNGGFWPAIISRDETEATKSWCIGKDIHVQFVSPPFVRACGQVIKERWVDVYRELVSFELLDQSRELFTSNNIRNAYLEAVEVFKEGKELPRWVENVVITASKIKGCPIGEDEIGDDDDEATTMTTMSPRANLDPSCEVNGHTSFRSESKSERKRSSRESFSSNSSIADSNQNKRMKVEEKHSNLNKHEQPYRNTTENGVHTEEKSPKLDQNVFHGQSESAVLRFMVETERGWQCTECDFITTTKQKSNGKQNLRRHVLVKHYEQEDIPCQYCEKILRNLPSYEHHVRVCSKRNIVPNTC